MWCSTEAAELAVGLQRPETRLEASETLRGLLDAIVLTPEEGEPPSRGEARFGEPRRSAKNGGGLRGELRGNLAAMLTAAQQTKGRRIQATFSRRLNWLRELATNIICSRGGVTGTVSACVYCTPLEQTRSRTERY